MTKEIIETTGVFVSRRPFSNGVRAGDTVYVAGRLAVDADDVRRQTRQVLENIRRIPAAVGDTLDDVVKTTV